MRSIYIYYICTIGIYSRIVYYLLFRCRFYNCRLISCLHYANWPRMCNFDFVIRTPAERPRYIVVYSRYLYAVCTDASSDDWPLCEQHNIIIIIITYIRNNIVISLRYRKIKENVIHENMIIIPPRVCVCARAINKNGKKNPVDTLLIKIRVALLFFFSFHCEARKKYQTRYSLQQYIT